MDALDVANRYFAAWNRRDSSAVAAIFPEDGTYSDPTIPGAIHGGAIAEYAAGLFAAFPDLSFEILHAAPTTDTRVAPSGSCTAEIPALCRARRRRAGR